MRPIRAVVFLQHELNKHNVLYYDIERNICIAVKMLQIPSSFVRTFFQSGKKMMLDSASYSKAIGLFLAGEVKCERGM